MLCYGGILDFPLTTEGFAEVSLLQLVGVSGFRDVTTPCALGLVSMQP